MDSFTNWDDPLGGLDLVTSLPNKIPLPHENFDEYFAEEYQEMDNLFNETLTGLQDLDVPSGFIESDLHKKHKRKISGTAIFGFADHSKDLSLGFTKSISPGEILTMEPANNGYQDKILLQEEDEDKEKEKMTQVAQLSPVKKPSDYVIPSDNPKAYRFPPSPLPLRYISQSNPGSAINNAYQNNYSVKYLQDLDSKDPITYVDDIEPLLDRVDQQSGLLRTHILQGQTLSQPLQAQSQSLSQTQNISQSQPQTISRSQVQTLSQPQPPNFSLSQPPTFSQPLSISTLPQFQSHSPFASHFHTQQLQIQSSIQQPYESFKYVPIPVQEPVYKKDNILLRNDTQGGGLLRNTFLPPPSPPTLSNGSPEWQSSPEPLSPTNRYLLLPVHPSLRGNTNFYQLQFFLEDNLFNEPSLSPLHSLPVAAKPLNLLPIKYSSPLRQAPSNDDTVEMNNLTIAQLTPLKSTLPNTPVRNQVQLEWSPIILPSAKALQDVKKHIKESLARRRIKKTSLLPPGELDQYWVGPDEDKIYTCTYKNCGKKFTRRYNVRSHIQTHLSDRPFGCPNCPKRFVRQHDLNRHVKGHLETTHCKCVCGKEFTRLDALKKHQLRNICRGGLMQTQANGIQKPKKPRSPELGGYASSRINDQLALLANM